MYCHNCGVLLPDSATVCPDCGYKVKNKKKFYKTWWFWAIVLLVFLSAVLGGGSEEEPVSPPVEVVDPAVEAEEPAIVDPTPSADTEPETADYIEVTAKQLFDEGNANALKAKTDWVGKKVKLTGFLSNIDSDGKYISVGDDDMSYIFDWVHCNITESAQLDIVMTKTIDDAIVVYGEITDYGEVLGYYLDIEGIE